jgi:hypothetical protein
LIPTANGGHACAADLVLGRSQDLRDLLPPELLRELLGPKSKCVGWVDASVTENRLPKVWQYLRDKCDTLVIDGETFARHITANFLDPRDEDWMIRFYSFLTGQEALWRPKGVYNYPPEGPLRKKPIVRCDDNSHICPFDAAGDVAVFAPAGDTPRNVSVKHSIYEDAKARAFFDRLGVRGRDPADDVIDMLLERYGAADAVHESSAYNADLRRLFRALNTDSRTLKERLLKTARTSFLAMAVNMEGKRMQLRPVDVYVPRDALKRYFAGGSDVPFLDDSTLSPDNLDVEKWKDLGASHRPRLIETTEVGQSEPRSHYSRWKQEFKNWEMAGLDNALARINTVDHDEAILGSQSIWTFLRETVSEQPGALKGLHRWHHYTWQSEEMESSFLCKLKKALWLPSIGKELKKPAELRGEEIDGTLTPDPFLFRLLGVRPDQEEVAKETLDTRKTLVTQAGFSPEVAALLVQNKDALTPEIINEIISAHTTADADRPEFPERPVPNPERRTAGVLKRVTKADPKTYDIRKRSVRVSAPQISPKVWLREMYTNKEDITVCQLCWKAMPFRIPTTGEYYFEAVQVADNFSKEDHCLYLALCPLCAAKYSVLVKKDHDRLSDFIWAVEQTAAGDLIVPVQTDGVTSHVRFVESHLLDLKAALTECLS